MESDRLLSSPSTPNILQRRRNTEDVIPLIIFCIFLLFWISVASYAFSTGDSSQVIPPHIVKRIHETLTISRIFAIIGFTSLAGLISFLVLVIYHIRNVTYTVLGVFWIPFTSSIIIAVFYPNFFTIIVTFATFCSAILILVLSYTEWFHFSDAVLKESCKVIRFFKSTLFLSTTWHLLCILVFIFALAVHLYLNEMMFSEKPTISMQLGNFFRFINIVAFIWLFFFICGIGQMVLCGMFATWFWTEEKRDIPKKMFLVCFKYVFRYHLGSIAYGTSVFGLIRVLKAVLKYAFERYRQGVNGNFKLFLICNLFDSVAVRFIMYNAIMLTSMYGKKFHQSVEDSLCYLLKHTKRCLMITKVIEYLLLVAIGYILFFMAVVLNLYLKQEELAADQQLMILVPICVASMVFVLSVFALFIATMNTIMLCTLDDFERNDDSEDRPYHMSFELQNALMANGAPNWYMNCQARPCSFFTYF